MQLEDDLWIEGGYYVDFDVLDQFRIIGPNNHLYCGLIDIPRHQIEIKKVSSREDGSVLVVDGYFKNSHLNFYYPIQEDIRTIRSISRHMHDSGTFHPVSFLQMRRGLGGPHEAAPMMVEKRLKEKGGSKSAKQKIIFRRYYGELWYGVTFEFSSELQIKSIDEPYKGFTLKCKSGLMTKFRIIAETNDIPKRVGCPLISLKQFDQTKFRNSADCVAKLWRRSASEIRHLICWGKTSGDRFGTVFPRDWMESAILGAGDFSTGTVDHMLAESLKNVNEKGQGWHEDVVGEYKYEHQVAGKDLFDRHMLDIEPLYFLTLPLASTNFCKQHQEVLARVANYLLDNALENKFITFKKQADTPIETEDKPPAQDKYYLTGNWRDSNWAHKQVDPIIAPFDVNAVFYPEALKVIKKYNHILKINKSSLDKAITKWRDKRKSYLYQEKEQPVYALALYSTDFKQLKVSHLDEAYLYFYSDASEAEVKSFSERVLDSKYFYTPGGPMIIAANNKYGYTNQEYHGLVVWTKEVAFMVGGLARQYELGRKLKWKKETLELIRKAVVKTSRNLIDVYHKLGHSFPELHIVIDKEPKHYTSQDSAETSSSRVQLWSAVGARRIIRELYKFL